MSETNGIDAPDEQPEPNGRLDDPPPGRFALGSILALGTIVLMILLPAILTGEQGPEKAPDQLEVIVVSEWASFPVTGAFATTPGLEAVPDGGGGLEAFFHALVGHNTGGANAYEVRTCGNIALIDRGATEFGEVAAVADCTPTPVVTSLDGYCCAPPGGWVGDDGAFRTAGTLSGSSRGIIQPLNPPGAPTPLPFPGGNQISTTYDLVPGGWVASTYDITGQEVDVFTRPWDSSLWSHACSVPGLGPFDGVHWGATAGPDGEKVFVINQVANQVSVTCCDLTSGAPDWTHQLDTVPHPPSSFHNYDCCYSGEVLFPDGSAGDALACSVPADDGQAYYIFGPVDGPGPPQYTADAWFPGSSPGDRHGMTCNGKMIYGVGPDLDGSGTRYTAINCGDLSGECVWMVHVDDSRTPQFSGFLPETIWVDGSVSRLVLDKQIVVEGYSGHVSVNTADMPGVLDNFEAADLHGWDRSVGVGPTPTPGTP